MKLAHAFRQIPCVLYIINISFIRLFLIQFCARHHKFFQKNPIFRPLEFVVVFYPKLFSPAHQLMYTKRKKQREHNTRSGSFLLLSSSVLYALHMPLHSRMGLFLSFCCFATRLFSIYSKEERVTFKLVVWRSPTKVFTTPECTCFPQVSLASLPPQCPRFSPRSGIQTLRYFSTV